MKKNLVSIVTPCYNGEYFIRRFLKSILNQTYSNWELCIADGASTSKETLDMLEDAIEQQTPYFSDYF